MKVTQSCPTLCNPMDYTVHGIFQARVLEWVAFPFSMGSSQPRDWTQVSRVAGRFFTSWATRKALSSVRVSFIPSSSRNSAFSSSTAPATVTRLQFCLCKVRCYWGAWGWVAERLGDWGLEAGGLVLGPRVWELGAGSWGLGAGHWELGSWGTGARSWGLGAGNWGLGARSCLLFSPVVSQEAGSQALSLWQVHGGKDHLSLSQ